MSQLRSKVESLLFISPKPLSIKKIAELAQSELQEVEEVVDGLMTEYSNRGMEIKRLGDKVQMMTSGDNHKLVQDFVKDEVTGELTRPSLETLTVIAYRGPISKPELELIRGVNCSLIIRNLLIRGLIEEVEDKNRGSLFNVTFDFLKFLGISQVTELPDYDKLNSDENLKRLLTGQLTDTETSAAI
ncbi:MAG: SMC-Scp complex subunit ScpB [Patescibacteria group bacterium]